MIRIKDTILRFKAWAEALLFPEGVLCLSCGCAPEGELESGLCEACAKALDAQRIRQESHPGDCPKELAFVHAAFPYEDPARRLIRMLKYDRVKSAAQPLIAAMAMLPSGEEVLIVPVPTTAKRLRERGFNQSLLLARGIGEALGMPVEDLLERIGEQKAQAALSGKERLQNLVGCMRAKRPLHGEKILLVDDVYTTGTTAKEAARALHAAGAGSVGVFAAARAVAKDEQPEFFQAFSDKERRTKEG